MNKILGILALFCFIALVTAYFEPKFLDAGNLENVTQRTALFGLISIGVAFVIITGGIDLSIGSVIGLSGVLFTHMIVNEGYSVGTTFVVVMVMSAALGLIHGLLIAGMKLQPFVVTLCGLLVYRGIARYISGSQSLGFGNDHEDLRYLATGKITVFGYEDVKRDILNDIEGVNYFQIPVPAITLIIVMLVAWVLLNKTIAGRYMLALGRNPSATRLSGIKTYRYEILAYVISSTLAGFGGILFALDINSVQGSQHGNFYELYAIAAAVLGGCSLRGGEGTIIGTVIGAGVMRLLYNSTLMIGIPTTLEFALIGIVILLGAIADEAFHRLAEFNRMRKKRNSQGSG